MARPMAWTASGSMAPAWLLRSASMAPAWRQHGSCVAAAWQLRGASMAAAGLSGVLSLFKLSGQLQPQLFGCLLFALQAGTL